SLHPATPHTSSLSLHDALPILFGIRFALESNHDIVSESHDDNIAVRPLLTPHLDPQVEHVMKIDVRQKRRSTSALRRTSIFITRSEEHTSELQSRGQLVCRLLL